MGAVLAGVEKKPLEWVVSAKAALIATMDKIHREDAHTAALVAQRIEKSLATVQSFPLAGTPVKGTRSRSYSVPHTGHSFNYRVTNTTIQVTRWYRQRQNVLR